MARDPALAFFLDDAERQGLTLSEYEQRYGVILPAGKFKNPAEARIKRHEISGGGMNDSDFAIAQHNEKRRAKTRRESRDVLPPNDCD